MESGFQSGILAPVPAFASYLFFNSVDLAQAPAVLQHLASKIDGQACVVGLGLSLVDALGVEINGLATFPAMAANGVRAPSTPSDLVCWIRASERGALIDRMHRIQEWLSGAFVLDQAVDAFLHETGRDLTGYEDGTENPEGDAAMETALVCTEEAGIKGSSFMVIQQWQHDFSRFSAMTGEHQDACIGRRKSDNAELADAPESAHVKRTAQESFEPEAFLLRRSMPWAEGARAGLMFVAFAHSFEPFEAQLARMCGMEDGVVDALFEFTRPLTGAYFWCPPMRAGALDLRALNAGSGACHEPA